MTMLELLGALILLGVIVGLINWMVPIDATFKKIIMGVAILIAVILVLSAFGMLGGISAMRLR